MLECLSGMHHRRLQRVVHCSFVFIGVELMRRGVHYEEDPPLAIKTKEDGGDDDGEYEASSNARALC